MAGFDFILDDEGTARPVAALEILFSSTEERDMWQKRCSNNTARLMYWVPIRYINLDGSVAMGMKEQPEEGEIVLCTDGSGVWADIFKDGGFFQSDDATAWMRLPSPYKKEGDA